jgi:exosome complex RNA-binding protein Rrp4
MPYIINKSDGTPLVTLEDGALDTSTSVGLLGRNYTGYGEVQNENFLHLLENFSSPGAPSKPVIGQTWFDSTRKVLNVYNGTRWERIGSATTSDTAPENPAVGSFWFKSPFNSLYIWNGSVWSFVGPEVAEGFGVTRANSTVIADSEGTLVPVMLLTVNDVVIGIISSRSFTVSVTSPIPGFINVGEGITLSSLINMYGNVIGKAQRAERFDVQRNINGVPFDGSANVTIKSSTTNKLKRGAYLTGNDFDGAVEDIWSVDASSSNIIGKVVARNSNGDFSAGTVYANLIGNVQGNVTVEEGTSNFNIVRANQFIGATLSGNAFSASRLQTPRAINNILFDGTADITVPSAAISLTGNTLNPTVVFSSLTSVGTLTSLKVNDAGITVGNGNQLSISVTSMVPTIKNNSTDLPLKLEITDSIVSGGSSGLWLLPSSISLSSGGEASPAIVPNSSNQVTLGHPNYRYKKAYSSEFIGALTGNATTATSAVTSTNLSGGANGSIPYQSAANTTTMLPAGLAGQILKSGGTSGLPYWDSQAFSSLKVGSYLIGSDYNTSTDRTWSVDATSSNTANKIVARDSNGDFSTAHISLTATPTAANHAVTKSYVDSSIYTITYGNTVYSTSGYTNQVGSFNNGANYFDVFPPSGKTMSNLVAFIPSIAVIHYAGGVDGNDSLRCTWSNLGDRIRVYVQNTEQRSTPAANYLAIWS